MSKDKSNDPKKPIRQRARLAMGDKVGFKSGGSVSHVKSGTQTHPLTDSKRANKVPGYNKGGKMADGC